MPTARLFCTFRSFLSSWSTKHACLLVRLADWFSVVAMVSMAFGIVGIIACLCCKDVDYKMTNKVCVHLPRRCLRYFDPRPANSCFFTFCSDRSLP